MASGGELYDDDESLPEPIYLRLDNKQFEYRDSYYEEELDDSGEELAEDQIGLDLAAPPPESWFHGRIRRQTAITRLGQIGDPGAYLIRESETQPGDYAISYLSKTGHVHHFKINSNCGDYYIGGRQFFSLGDLIGFYANCSCILENESLAVPVVPPRPVPLYMMLRSKAPHTKTPGTDELSIVPGEVFVLLSRLNDDWGWGRSQRTGESGLIPIVIMEDMTEEDPNLGRPWFLGSITRDEAGDLLMRKGDIGSFLVRTSVGGDGQVRYSLSVRTPDRVQRFLIQKYDTGYYFFGGRPFNTIDDIVDRYRSEVILDGLKLGSPVPQEPQLLDHRMAAHHPGAMRERTNSVALTRAELPGDKSGRLLLRKGKKSPVYGKWKEFYFVLKYRDHQLLYFDHENSHRARGLLDLKQCQVYAVHPSLFGRSDCLVLMLRYLNELSFYYLCAESLDNTQDWLQLLRRYTTPKPRGDPNQVEVQQLRSLTLSIRDCKLAKGATHIFGLVAIDGACIARTKVATDVPCVFDEGYQIESLPPQAETFSVEISNATKSKVGTMLGRDSTFGKVNIHFSDLPNGQQDDQWHQLLASGARTARGSLRLVANFKHEVILPLEEYRNLKELVLGDDLTVIKALALVCKEHHAELASTLIQIFCQYNRIVPIVTACLAASIESEENVATLFRASTLSTMLMDQFMKLTASDYLYDMLRDPIQEITDSAESCELNPSKLARGVDLSQNLERLQSHLQNVLSSIFKSVERCPPTLRYIFMNLQEKVIQKWPTDESVRTRAVSGFLFLRFICPALIKPQLFNLITEPATPMADRTLKLVAKAIQNLANLVEFRGKEPFMAALNPFIVRNLPRMRTFVDDISNYGKEPSPAGALASADPARDLASIYHLCCTYEKALEVLAQKKTYLMKLLGVMQSLRLTEKKYLNKYS